MEYGIQDNIMNPQLLREQHLTYNYILEERNRRKDGMKQLWQTADALIQHHKIKHSNLKWDSLAVWQVLPVSAHVNDQQ